METNENKSTVTRRTLILEKLDANGQVSVNDLSETFGVSEVTIRNDLTRLEQKNMLIRARGGAIKATRVGTDFELSKKHRINLKQKERIGKEAAKLIEEGDTIIIGGGTTTQELAKNVGDFNNLTTITNALNIANELTKKKYINLIMPGGLIRKESLSLLGGIAERALQNFYCDKTFMGVDGLDTDHGLTTPSSDEAHINQIMIEISRQVIILADSSKFFRRSFALIAPISKIDILITDNEIDPECKKKFENIGIQVIVV